MEAPQNQYRRAVGSELYSSELPACTALLQEDTGLKGSYRDSLFMAGLCVYTL